jgi:hypothetical protein
VRSGFAIGAGTSVTFGSCAGAVLLLPHAATAAATTTKREIIVGKLSAGAAWVNWNTRT